MSAVIEETTDLGLDRDKDIPCRAKRHTGDAPAMWLLHLRCPGCKQSIRDVLCDPCWQRWISWPGNAVCLQCGQQASPADYIVRIDRIRP